MQYRFRTDNNVQNDAKQMQKIKFKQPLKLNYLLIIKLQDK